MNTSLLGLAIKFSNYNLVFDGLILFFTLIYFFAGLKRGMKRTLWYVIFDLISIVAATVLCKIVCPLFINYIPNLVPSLLAPGLKFFVVAIFKSIITLLVGVLIFLIIRFGIFKKVLIYFADRDYNLRRKKKRTNIRLFLTRSQIRSRRRVA